MELWKGEQLKGGDERERRERGWQGEVRDSR